MIPSHLPKGAERQSRSQVRRWRLCTRLGRRLFKKLVLVGSCIALILLLSSLDAGEADEENYGTWDCNLVQMDWWVGNMSQRMAQRRHHLQDACERTGLNIRANDSLHQPNVWELLINTKHHLVWCNVFKAASTSWMYNFNILAGYNARFLQTTKQVPLQLARKRYPRPSYEQLLQAQNHSTATTFLIVRHPFQRLLSGYRDKIENALAHTYHHKLNTYIILHYRNHHQIQTQKKGGLFNKRKGRKTCPTFSEFVDYLIDLYKTGKEFDMHWTPINAFCTPCQIHFDVILKLETLEEDQNYLIYRQKLERWIRPQWKNPSKSRSKTTNIMKHYFSQLSTHQMHELYEIYRYDMLLFNYTMDAFLEYANDVTTFTKDR